MAMEQIIFSDHTKVQMIERGASKKEIVEAITDGEAISAKHGRIGYRKNFQYNNKWGKKFYHIKQVIPIVKKEADKVIVITVYTFYF
ncbi:MAG: DUF4258 domain-containing protein [Patescibacteria group bacterium]